MRPAIRRQRKSPIIVRTLGVEERSGRKIIECGLEIPFPLMSHNMSSFAYRPLERLANRPSIRLAVLKPGSRDDPLRINLKHTTFADKPKYESLSYTWGSATNVKAIEINGVFIPIRRNLDRALRHFRRKDQERVLWIDAICINQADDAEKSWQVKLMADIYRRAQCVFVWVLFIDEI